MWPFYRRCHLSINWQWYAVQPDISLNGELLTVKWDLDNPHTLNITVQPEDIDGLGHANNTVYVGWLERCAWEHSQRLGLGVSDYRTLDRAMAVFRHEIDYLSAAYEGDELVMATWIINWDKKLRMTRHFQLCRVSDGATLLRARTTFVCIEVSTGKPKRMPAEFIEVYARGITPEKSEAAAV